MKKFLFFSFFINVSLLSAQVVDKDKVDALIKSQNKGFGIETLYKFGNELISQDYRSSNIGNINPNNESLKKIVDFRERLNTQNAIGVNTLIAGSAIVKTGVCGFALYDPEPTTKIVAAGLCLGVSKGMDYLVDLVDKEATKNLDVFTKKKLQELKVMNEAEYNLAINSTDNKQFLSIMNKNVDFINDLKRVSGETTDDNFKEILEETANEYTTQLIKNGIEKTLKNIDATNANVDELGKEIKGIRSSMKSYIDKQQKELKSIKDNITDLKTDYNSIIKEQQELTNSVGITQEILLQKMTPEEKLRFLKNKSFLPHLSEPQKKLLTKQAEAEVKKVKLLNSITKTLQGGRDIVSVFDNLGVNNEFTKTLSKSVSVGETLFSTYTNFAAGNYLGAAASFTGLFAKKGPDIAQIRHEQIMKALGQISGQLTYLKQDNDTIKEQLKLIIESQQQIVEEIQDLENTVYKLHLEEVKLIKDVYDQTLYLEILLNDSYIKDLNHCANLFNTKFQTPIYDSKKPISFTIDSTLSLLREDATNNCNECVIALNKLIGSDVIPEIYKVKSLNSLTSLGSPIRDNDLQKLKSQKRNLTDSFFIPTFNFVENQLKNDNKSLLMAMLTSFDVRNLLIKQDSIKSNESIPKTYVINDCLDPNVILFMSEYVLRWNYLSNYMKFDTYGEQKLIKVYDNINEMIDPYITEKLKDKLDDRKLDNANVVNKTRNISLLKRYIEYINMCIVQQTVIDGDFNLQMYDDILMKDLPNSEELIKIINRNPILADNYIMYHCYKALNNKDSIANNILYSSFYSKPTSKVVFKKLLNLPYDIKYEKDNDSDLSPRWKVAIGEKYYNLPDPFSLKYGILTHNSDLIDLLTMRAKMADAITSYGLIDNFQGKDREILNQLILGVLK